MHLLEDVERLLPGTELMVVSSKADALKPLPKDWDFVKESEERWRNNGSQGEPRLSLLLDDEGRPTMSALENVGLDALPCIRCIRCMPWMQCMQCTMQFVHEYAPDVPFSEVPAPPAPNYDDIANPWVWVAWMGMGVCPRLFLFCAELLSSSSHGLLLNAK